jgi:hypothetical protein
LVLELRSAAGMDDGTEITRRMATGFEFRDGIEMVPGTVLFVDGMTLHDDDTIQYHDAPHIEHIANAFKSRELLIAARNDLVEIQMSSLFHSRQTTLMILSTGLAFEKNIISGC